MASPPARSATAFVCHIRLVRTSASRWTETARKALGGLEQLAGLAEGLHVGVRLLALGRLAVPVDPDHGDLLLEARLDVGGIARGDVDPVPLGRPDPPRALLEVG